MIKQHGIALVSVLAVATVCIILAAIFSFTITSERKSANATAQLSSGVQLADAATERARLNLVDEYKKSYLTSEKFLKALDDNSGDISALLGTKTVTIGDRTVRWKLADWADPKDSLHWVDIAATADAGKGSQTVIRRINLGQSDIFSLAMLAERTDCIYCHLQVNGDVGSLDYLRPGWGKEQCGVAPDNGWGEGFNSGSISRVNGDVFVAPKGTSDAPSDNCNPTNNITLDATDLTGDPVTINGAQFNEEVFTDYSGSRLPSDKDGDGIPDFPAITKDVAEKNADGKLSGGKVLHKVPAGSSLGGSPTATDSISESYDGNLVLIGTKDKPIKLDGDVYISGDVIIKGYVEGQGAIYAGRNIYVAGDVIYDSDFDNCGLTSDPNGCAQQSISANDDELRLAARGNIIMGDYTECTDNSISCPEGSANRKAWQGLQAADFYRRQFGFDGDHYYDAATGDELELVDGEFKNADGTVIPSGNVITASGDDAYNNSMRPGTVSASGFTSWISDALYQDILGVQKRAYDTWRFDVARSGLTLSDLQKQFAGMGVSDSSLTDLLCNDTYTTCASDIDLTNDDGTIIGRANWNGGNSTIRVIIDPPTLYESHVNRVDAYVYSNQRIAGKTFNAPLTVNGGLVSKEIGILAPGVRRNGWMPATYPDGSDRYGFLGWSNEDCTNQAYADNFRDTSLSEGDAGYYNGASQGAINTGSAPDSEALAGCKLTVNYDHRLMNGGLGFNLVAEDVGRTVSWRVGDKRSDRVE